MSGNKEGLEDLFISNMNLLKVFSCEDLAVSVRHSANAELFKVKKFTFIKQLNGNKEQTT